VHAHAHDTVTPPRRDDNRQGPQYPVDVDAVSVWHAEPVSIALKIIQLIRIKRAVDDAVKQTVFE
jgi:hypothetical protein